MKLTFEELWFLIQALYTAHGPNDDHDPVSERRAAADLIDKLGAEAVGRYQMPPDFAVWHLSAHLRSLADHQEQLYEV
jgi:hypothetical protein